MFLLYDGLETHFDFKFSNKEHPIMEKVVMDEEQKDTGTNQHAKYTDARESWYKLYGSGNIVPHHTHRTSSFKLFQQTNKNNKTSRQIQPLEKGQIMISQISAGRLSTHYEKSD